MNIDDGKMSESWRSMSIFSISCFVFLFTNFALTRDAAILGVKMVFCKWVRTWSPMTLYCPKHTTQTILFVGVVGIWYNELKTFFTSYVTPLEICKEPTWKPKITHKHCLNVSFESNSLTKMVSPSYPSTQKWTQSRDYQLNWN